jgi:endoglucanase
MPPVQYLKYFSSAKIGSRPFSVSWRMHPFARVKAAARGSRFITDDFSLGRIQWCRNTRLDRKCSNRKLSRPATLVALIMLATSVLAPRVDSVSFAETTVAPVGLNTIGYPVNVPKKATLSGGSQQFRIRDIHTNEVVFRGNTTVTKSSENSDEPLAVADFSELRRPGEYQLVLGEVAKSSQFRIGDDVDNGPFFQAVHAMYLWRCGTAVTGQAGGVTFQHAACHLQDGYLDYADGNPGEKRDAVGGWHDAGDYNKYAINGAFTAAMMLRAWEDFHKRLAPLDLRIPESRNDVPDFLDEVRWELEWLLKMQTSDGRVYHKLSTLKFGRFTLPEDETARRYFSPWGSAATADFAAVMAQAARVYEPYDAEFSRRCLAAALASYEYLRTRPEDHQPIQAAFSTGCYDTTDDDDRVWAAAELWVTTGRDEFLKDFEQRARAAAQQPANLVDADWDWSHVRNLGMFTYVLSSRAGRDSALVDRITEDTVRSADAIAGLIRRNAYGRSLGCKYYWGCNGTVARLAINLHVAYVLTNEAEFQTAMGATIDYLFGRNPFGRSFITGLGHQPPQHPHDRRCGSNEGGAAWPGCLVGGPWPTAADWHDVQSDFRTNEIAINWNGALIYALAAFVDPNTFEASLAATAQIERSPGDEQ